MLGRLVVQQRHLLQRDRRLIGLDDCDVLQFKHLVDEVADEALDLGHKCGGDVIFRRQIDDSLVCLPLELFDLRLRH